MREILDSGRILVPESDDDAPCTEQLESLGIGLDEFVKNGGRSRLGELPAVSSRMENITRIVTKTDSEGIFSWKKWDIWRMGYLDL
jgi:hypothetical protein